jgi:apolipoprotein N-acyltransferase
LLSALCVMLIYQKSYTRLFYLLGLICIISLGSLLATFTWTTPSSKSITISLVQGNVPQELKWETSQITRTLALYQRLTTAHWTSKIIIWPEAAVTALGPSAQAFLASMEALAQQHHSALITGLPLLAKDLYHAYNALLVVGNGQGLYRKQFLVPFGEYVPFENTLRGLLNILNLPMSEFIPGPLRQNLPIAAGIPFAPFICYEIAYAKAVQRFLPQAQLLIVISNDAWFGDSWALAQHLQITQFQAIATGRYAAVVSNTGLTAIIKPNGILAASLAPFKQGVLTSTVQAYQGATPWVKYGNTSLLMLALLVLGLANLRKN